MCLSILLSSDSLHKKTLAPFLLPTALEKGREFFSRGSTLIVSFKETSYLDNYNVVNGLVFNHSELVFTHAFLKILPPLYLLSEKNASSYSSHQHFIL